MCFGQHAQRTGDVKMPAFGLGAACLLVDQEAVGVDGEGEGDGRLLASIEKSEGGDRRADPGEISHHAGGCAIHARTVPGVFVAWSSPARPV